MRVKLKVEGMWEFRKALRAVDTELPKQLRKGFNEVAELVANEAADRVPVRSGALRDSIRPRSTQSEGRVVMGRASVPYAGWIDFGGTISPRGAPMTRDFRRNGRYLFVAADDLAPRIRKETVDVLNRFVDKAGLG